MIKFIASDLDGTILLDGAQKVDESLIGCIETLVNSGVFFAPASGRHIVSLKRLFEPVCAKLAYIAENGALVCYRDEVIAKTVMNRKMALEIIEDVLEQPDCEVLVSGEKSAYIKPKSQAYLHRMTKVVNYKTTLVDNFSDIDEDILKIAVCNLSGINNSREHFFNKWQDKTSITVSGQFYLDLMEKNVSKGRAVCQVQDYFGITQEECMAFGDNFNDISMLDAVGQSYAMEKAADEVKKHAKYVSDKVENVLRKEFALLR